MEIPIRLQYFDGHFHATIYMPDDALNYTTYDTDPIRAVTSVYKHYRHARQRGQALKDKDYTPCPPKSPHMMLDEYDLRALTDGLWVGDVYERIIDRILFEARTAFAVDEMRYSAGLEVPT